MGRLIANTECKQTQGGKMYCRFQIAINRPKQQNGTQQADFISCVAWGKTAETISQYFVKGKPIVVEGSLHNNNYTDKNNVQHYGLDVWLDKFEFVLSDNNQNQAGYNANRGYQQNYPPRPDSVPNTMQQFPQLPSENLDDYEKIISDGEIPF